MEGLRNKKSSSSSSIRRIDAVDTISSVTSKGGNSSIIQSANAIANTLKDDDGINIITCRSNTDVSMVDSSSSSSSNITSTRGDAKDNASYGVSSNGINSSNSRNSSEVHSAVNDDNSDVKEDQGPSSHRNVDSRKNTDRFTTLMMARREGGGDDDGDRVMDYKRSKI